MRWILPLLFHLGASDTSCRPDLLSSLRQALVWQAGHRCEALPGLVLQRAARWPSGLGKDSFVARRFWESRYATMLLLDDGCYANMYTNITVVALATSVASCISLLLKSHSPGLQAAHRGLLGCGALRHVRLRGRLPHALQPQEDALGRRQVPALRAGRPVLRGAPQPPAVLHLCGRELLSHRGDGAKVLFGGAVRRLALPGRSSFG